MELRGGGCFPDKVELGEFVITKPLLYETLKDLVWEGEEDQEYEHGNGGRMAATQNHQQLNLKNKGKDRLSKQLEQEQSHRYGDHLDGCQLEGGEG